MSDEDGRPVICQAAVRMRDDLLEQLCALPAVGSALDHIIARFGTDPVDDVPGRSRRIVEDGGGRQHVESRSRRTNLVEPDALMRGPKRTLLFSDAGGTSRTYQERPEPPK